MKLVVEFKQKIKNQISKFRFREQLNGVRRCLQNSRGEPRILLFQTPEHTNIGDHAIAEAELLFLKKYLPAYKIVEINQAFHYPILKRLKTKQLVTSDIIMLHGGGNFGNQYMREELIRRSVVRNFPDNKIIVFPQTMYYMEDVMGHKELNETKAIFDKHTNLTLIAREEVSYQQMKLSFPNNKVLLAPDIVLSMDMTEQGLEREGILMVLRADEEKLLSQEQHNHLDTLAYKMSDTVIYSDMHYHTGAKTLDERKRMLDFKFNQFRSSKLVITDRLHGMVLAAITGTPCIAFSNYNQKVSGTYEWISDLNYIRFVAVNDDIEKEVQYLYGLQEIDRFDPSKYKDFFEKIIYAIND